MIFFEGMFLSRPSRLRPLLMAIQSSPVSKKQSSISTLSQHSGSHPSPLGPSLIIFTRRTVISVEWSGWITQKGERSRVISSRRIPSHLLKLTSCGRRPSFSPNTRSGERSPFSLYIGMPSSPAFSRRGRASFFWLTMPSFHPKRGLPFQGHQASLLPPPSMVPLPVMAISLAPKAYMHGERLKHSRPSHDVSTIG